MMTSSKGIEEDKNKDRHGLRYLPREKQPSMFDHLSWEHDPLKSKDWLHKMQPSYQEAKLTEPQVYQKPEQNHPCSDKQQIEVFTSETKHKLKAHSVKHELYYYGEEKVSPSRVKATGKGSQQERKGQKEQRQMKRLDQFNEVDKREIEIRKKNLKDFKYHTRGLPDSAFTTYFGKPAFAHYGAAAKGKCISKHKSHSVMPHAGSNQPEFVQSHAGALDKANVINLESRIPKQPTQRKPIEPCQVKVSQYYNIEIVTPDLVNQVKFSNGDYSLKMRQKTPSHKDLNYLPKRKYAPPLHIGKKNTKKPQIRSKTEEKQDGLAFMNRREKFISDIVDKKKRQSRLAYKVTECYPLDWQIQTEANSTARQDKWNQVRPAGVTSTKYLKVQSGLLTE